MDMSNTPATEAQHHKKPASLPGEPHNRDMSNPGEMGFFLLALVLLGALGAAFAFAGVTGIGLVMVALVPVIYLILITISVGR